MDLAGNVREWCANVWHDNYRGAPADGSAWVTGGIQNPRVLRGGAWLSVEITLRSAYRYRNTPGNRNDSVGFRLAAGT